MEQRSIDQRDECFSLIGLLKGKLRSDGGFSGVLHATTAIFAVSLFFLGLIYFNLGLEFFGPIAGYIVVLVLTFAVVWIGYSVYPDLDNSISTSHIALGLPGRLISLAFRTISTTLQTLIRTGRDDSHPDPHRGFFHTPLSAALLGFGAWFLCSLEGTIATLPLIGELTWGRLFAIILVAAGIQLFVAALGKSFKHKVKKIFHFDATFLFSLVFAVALLSFIPASYGYGWIGIAIAGGGVTHILGDGFTKDGVPLFFPIVVLVRKKFWWKTRFAKLTSGDEGTEKIVYLISVIAAAAVFGFTCWLVLSGTRPL